MPNSKPTPESHAAELAEQAKFDKKHPDLGQMLYDLHPTMNPTRTYASKKIAYGWFNDLYVCILPSYYTIITKDADDTEISERLCEGRYSYAQAWLAEHLK